MFIREAKENDIPQIQLVRNAVTENMLSDPSLVSDDDCRDYLLRRGKGWVCESHGSIVGFAIADLQEKSIWALFLRPEWEKKGLGKALLQHLLNWYFAQTKATVWLSTAPGTRAEGFYRKTGWKETGTHGKGEIRFELSFAEWGAQTGSFKNGNGGPF